MTRQMQRELDYYSYIPQLRPIEIEDYIYYRRIENAADVLTVYRFPVSELPKWELLHEKKEEQ